MFDPARTVLGFTGGVTAGQVIRELANLLAAEGPEKDLEEDRIANALSLRERLASTAVGNGVAFPHARVHGVTGIRAALITLPEPGIEMSAADGKPVRIVAALVCPEESGGDLLKALGTLSRRLREEPIRRALLDASAPEAAIRILKGDGT